MTRRTASTAMLKGSLSDAQAPRDRGAGVAACSAAAGPPAAPRPSRAPRGGAAAGRGGGAAAACASAARPIASANCARRLVAAGRVLAPSRARRPRRTRAREPGRARSPAAAAPGVRPAACPPASSHAERDGAGEQVEGHAAERVDVGGRADGLAADLLGRDVVERAEDLAGLRLAAGRGARLVSPKSVR